MVKLEAVCARTRKQEAWVSGLTFGQLPGLYCLSFSSRKVKLEIHRYLPVMEVKCMKALCNVKINVLNVHEASVPGEFAKLPGRQQSASASVSTACAQTGP